MSLLTLVIPIAEHLIESSPLSSSAAVTQLKSDVLSVAKVVLGNVVSEVETDICDWIDLKVMAKAKSLGLPTSMSSNV